MTVIAFPPKPECDAGGWTPEERTRFEAFFAARARSGEASEYGVTKTENGDPQFFLVGPEPACDCVLSISRVSGRYVIEDGEGTTIAETASLEEFFRMAARLRLRRKTGIVARVVLAWYGFREFVHEKTEAVATEMVEVTEVLTHVMPQIAAIA